MSTTRPSGRAVTLLALACSLAVFAMFAWPAGSLLRYPWDWAPDEGLSLDYGRRVLEAPAALYAKSAVPFPSAWGPVLPVVMAPAAASSAPLLTARLIALSWTVAGALAVFVLVRREGSRALALATSALALGNLDLSFFHLILRPDGLLLALWLWAAVALLPRRLERSADRLSAPRIAAGCVLLLLAALVKMTAVLHGAPLVLGWLLVDYRSAARLVAALVATGGLAVFALQWATSGGFLWVTFLWGHHSFIAGQTLFLLLYVLIRAWPIVVLVLVGVLAARRAGHAPHGESAWLLVAGALLIVPALGKFGASWNYLLPLVAALAVAAGRLLATAVTPSLPRDAGALAVAAVAVAVAAVSHFPLPSAEDERTAASFYSMVTAISARAQAPILALRPELAYFLVGQPTEVEGSGFESLAADGVPGTELVLDRLRGRRYSLVVVMWNIPTTPQWIEALGTGYAKVASCSLGYYFGRFDARLFARSDLGVRVQPPGDTRCRAQP